MYHAVIPDDNDGQWIWVYWECMWRMHWRLLPVKLSYLHLSVKLRVHDEFGKLQSVYQVAAQEVSIVATLLMIPTGTDHLVERC